MCDRWLESQLRLAERQGLLTGHLNAVQTFGVQVLMMLDQQATSEGWWRDFRARIGAANPQEIRTLFPEFFEHRLSAEEIDRQARGEDGVRDLDRVDESQIVWGVPASEEEREDVEAFLAEALARTHTVNVNELEGGQWL